jgi:hypothetical protein
MFKKKWMLNQSSTSFTCLLQGVIWLRNNVSFENIYPPLNCACMQLCKARWDLCNVSTRFSLHKQFQCFISVSGSQEDNFLHAMRDSPARYPL